MSTSTKPESAAARKRREREEAREFLRGLLKPGDTVYVIQKHVSRNGMSRRLTLFTVENGRPRDITRMAAEAAGFKFNDDWTITVGGVGMDMHFHTVYSLSRALFPDGHKCTGKVGNCPSNDHSNDYSEAGRLFDKTLADRGEERLDYHVPGGAEQHAERAAFITEVTGKGGKLGYRRSRVHKDGGYALRKETF